MRASLLAITSVLIVSGCDLQPTNMPQPLPAGSAMKDSDADLPSMRNRFVRFEDMEPEQARRAREILARAEARAEDPAVRRRRALNETHPVRHAVSDGALPAGAVAVVIRDPASEWPRVVVLSRHSATDEALALADAALERDERAVPEPAGRRVLRVGWDRHVTTEAPTEVERTLLDLRHPHPTERWLMTPLLNAAERNPAVHIDGVGTVRFAEF